MPRIIAYIDGFNFYYGCLKNTPYKWVNPCALLEKMFPHDSLEEVKYFTAKVSPRGTDKDQPIRQEIYWRALRTLPKMKIICGSFLTKPKCIPIYRAQKKPVRTWIASWFLSEIRKKEGVWLAYVLRTEEKGSDVNLAAHLINDAHFKRCDHSVLVTGDSDLLDAVKIVVNEVGIPITVVNPQKRVSRELKAASTHYRHIHKSELAATQFPTQIVDAKGSFSKPPRW